MKVISFITGLGVGAAMALLFAPRSGEDTREMLSDSAEQGRKMRASERGIFTPRPRRPSTEGGKSWTAGAMLSNGVGISSTGAKISSTVARTRLNTHRRLRNGIRTQLPRPRRAPRRRIRTSPKGNLRCKDFQAPYPLRPVGQPAELASIYVQLKTGLLASLGCPVPSSGWTGAQRI